MGDKDLLLPSLPRTPTTSGFENLLPQTPTRARSMVEHTFDVSDPVYRSVGLAAETIRPPPEPESPTFFNAVPHAHAHAHADPDTAISPTYPHQPFRDNATEPLQKHPMDTAEDGLTRASDALSGSVGPSTGPMFSAIPSSSSATSGLFSTPSSGARLSSYFNGPATRHHRDTLPTLRDDLDKYTGQIPTQDFFPRVLGVSLETIEKWSQDLEPLMGYSEVVDALDRYFAADTEPEHYQPFADLLNVIKAAAPHLVESGVDFPVGHLCFVRNDPTYIKGDTVKPQWAHRKPDVVGLREDDLVDDPQDHIADDIHWADVLLALEFKFRNATNALRESWKKTKAKWESVNWAAKLWYFDACGILRTPKEISILENFTTFAAVVVALCSLTPQQWGETQIVKGYEPPVGPDAPAVEEFPRRSLTGGLVTFPDHRVYKLKECLASQYTLVGRRTTVYSAMFHHREQEEDPSDKELASKEVVVKLSYQICKRTPEWDFIDDASKAGINRIPTIFSRGDFEKLSDSVQRKGLSLQEQGRIYEDRILRGLVTPRYQKVTDVLEPNSFTRLLGQVVICLQRLRSINILHRDISVGNILCEERPDHKFDAIVNDFDLATRIKDDGSPEVSLSNHRTGTLPFMALELLRKQTIQHRLRHDLESLFYVAVWWAIEKDSTDNHNARNALAKWNQGPEEKVALVKRDFLEKSFIVSKATFTGPYFTFEESLQQLREMFHEVNFKLQKLDEQERQDQVAADNAERKILQQTSERKQTALMETIEDDDLDLEIVSKKKRNKKKT
ncbi:hypothetical protein EWM64_g8308 [Hericium alpestre]|uniref:Protein kinase domain-containing protein n=1 Tax=Hericium alpestre TaxID=135208 RepID=A0A4Y9ZN69_9AGAM|nr:hypothetical protein EWM64_g8308 [Hericium alpestre]